MEPLAPGMRRTGKVMRRMPGASIATATDAQIAQSSGASAPEFFASILQGKRPKGVGTEDRTVDPVPGQYLNLKGILLSGATEREGDEVERGGHGGETLCQ